MRRLLITDLDNTLYNFIDYFGPSFRGIVSVLSNETKLEKCKIISDFKRVYKQRGSLEYAFAIQELDLARELSDDAVFNLIEKAEAVFLREREKNLVPYGGVHECLKWLRNEGVIIVGLSNAPIFNAQTKLKQLKLDCYFDALAAWEGPSIPNSKYNHLVVDYRNLTTYKSQIEQIWPIPKEFLKPSTYAFNLIQQHFTIDNKNIWVIGDSIYSDIEPALEMGFNGIWARYGTVHSDENLATTLEVTSWDKNRIEKSFFKEYCEPKYSINSFGELRNIFSTLNLKC